MDIKIVIGAVSQSAEAVLQRVTGAVRGIGSAANSASRVVGDKLTGAFASFAKNEVVQAFSAQAVLSYAARTLEWADALEDLADRVKLDTDELQLLDQVAKSSGVSLEAIAKALKRLTIAKAEAAAGKGEKAEAFQWLGVPLDTVRSSSAIQLWRILGRAIENSTDEAEALRRSVLLLGQNADQIIPAMRQDLVSLREEMQRSGRIVSKDVVADLAKQQQQLEASLATLKGIAAPILSGLSTGAEAVGLTVGSGLRGFATAGYQAMGNTQRANELRAYTASQLDQYGERYANLYLVDQVSQERTNEMERKLEAKRAPLIAARKAAAAEAAAQASESEKPSGKGAASGSAKSFGADALVRIGLFRGGYDPAKAAFAAQTRELRGIRAELQALRREVAAE